MSDRDKGHDGLTRRGNRKVALIQETSCVTLSEACGGSRPRAVPQRSEDCLSTDASPPQVASRPGWNDPTLPRTLRSPCLTRRALLRGGVAYAAVATGTAALLGGAGFASSLGVRSKVRLAQLRYGGGNPIPRPTGLMRLAWELDKRTSVDVAAKPIVLDLDSKAIFRYPFLYLGGDQAFPLPPPSTIAKLRRHLVFGGFLLIDSAEAQPGAAFDTSARALIRAIFPKDPLRPIPRKHVLYKSFYLLDGFVGRVATVSQLEGVARAGRMALVYAQNDLAGAWARDNFGQWNYSVYPGGARQRELAFRWGINLVMYALCLDYKADQVHIPFILKRRRWQVGP